MRRLPKDRCGYQGYKCTGITLMPAPDPICCDNRDQFGVSDSRSIDNNFYNIPSKFLGIVQQTNYIDLQGVQQSSSCCHFEYDPFDPAGFSDLFDPVSKNQNYIGSITYSGLDNYGCSDSAYHASDAIQKPGFLLPSPQLNGFYPPVLQAVPTVALASPIGGSIHVNVDRSIKSACTGFEIYAGYIGNTISGRVTDGYIFISDTGSTVEVSGRGFVVQSLVLQVYVTAWYDFNQREWKGRIEYKTGQTFSTSMSGKKFAQLGTIRVQDGAVQVIQQTCSPVDVRDWVSQVAIPNGSGGTLYVFTYTAGSHKKEWIQVKDCN